MSQITIRDLAPQVELIIRQRAAAEGVSLSKAVGEILCEAVGYKPGETKYRDLSELSGTWSVAEASEFDRSMDYFERIDEELWK